MEDLVTLLLPVTNTAAPALTVSGSGDAITIGSHGILRNASGAGSGTPILLTGSLKIMDGGRYVHQTARGNAILIDKLSTAPGTEKGVFEFDVPGLAGYTVSLTSNTFGTLSFRALTAGGTKSYSGSGTGNLQIRGDLVIETGVQLSSTLTADILIGGSLQVEGRLNLAPVTTGSTGRSLKFTGQNALLTGTGQISMNANFRVMEITAGSRLTMNRNCTLDNLSNAFINYGVLETGQYIISGPGKFAQADLATLICGSPAGLQASGDSGNIQTGIREFSKKSAYLFQSQVAQRTGSGLPDTVSALGVNNAGGITLSERVYCTDSLLLYNGQIHTDSVKKLIFGGRTIKSPANNYGQVNAGWENSFISGPMSIESSDTGSLAFPIGASNIFAPLKIRKPLPGMALFETMYHSAPSPETACSPPLVSVSPVEYWTVTNNGDDFYGGYISFSVRPASVPTGNTYELAPAIYSLEGNDLRWIPLPGSKNINSSFGWIGTDSLVTGFRDITLGFALPAQPLPFRLLYFNARSLGKVVHLGWQADEDNERLQYSIERSKDGRLFTRIDSFASSGKNFARYEITDDKPLAGDNYYRLCIQSGNRKEYSLVRKATIEMRNAMIFPNPARDQVSIYFPGLRSRYELSIVNIHGLVVYKTFVNTFTCQIRVSNLRNGMYFVMLRHNKELITLPFTKY